MATQSSQNSNNSINPRVSYKGSDEKADQTAFLDQIANLMDSKFRIPGTDIRFGIDPILSLFPVAGDLVSYSISALMVLAMVRHGASGMLVLRMLGNLTLDATVGAIPILGDIFDVTYKANRRNVALLREHLLEGKHKQSGIWIFFVALAFIIALFVFLMYALVSIAQFFWQLIGF